MTIRNIVSALLAASIILLSGCAGTRQGPITTADPQHTYHSDPYSYRGSRRAFPDQIDPPGKKLFIFSPKLLAWAAYTPEGQLVGFGRASGGGDWCEATNRPCRTPAGDFTMSSRLGGYDCKSGTYPLPDGGAHMPYCMFYQPAYAIHGAPPESVPNYNASHGCIRVTTPAAKWLRYYFIAPGTKVRVLPY